MHSPKFKFSVRDLETCTSDGQLKTVWKKSLGAQIRKQLLIDLIEHRDFQLTLGEKCLDLSAELRTGDYVPQSPRQYLIEKSRGLCRQMTIVQPRDLLVLQVLSLTLYEELKASSPTSKAYFEPGDQKFEEGKLLVPENDYGSYASWIRFQSAIFNFSKERKYVVVADVANFYDFINFAHLRNIISSCCSVRESLLDLLIYCLNQLSWNPDYMPRTEMGLPQIQSDGPRVLANAMLYELDRVASEHGDGDYVRFMDDIDVGVDTIAAAKEVVRDIDLTLQSRQLRLNSSKTQILSTGNGEVAGFFCIKENKFLDYCAAFTEKNEKQPNQLAHVKKALGKAYQIWRGASASGSLPDGSRFRRGNGSKIYKRVVKYMYANGMRVDDADLLWVIKNLPSLREFSFRWLAFSKRPNSTLAELGKMLDAKVFVDDASYINLANFVVHTKFYRTTKLEADIASLVAKLSARDNFFSLYAAVLIGSKCSDNKTLLKLVASIPDKWRNDFWMSRLVGGLYPRFVHRRNAQTNFFDQCSSFSNEAYKHVVEFHQKIVEDVDFAKLQFDYAKSANPTFPQGIIHPKALIILSIRKNSKSKDMMSVIRKAHKVLKNDPFYSKWNF